MSCSYLPVRQSDMHLKGPVIITVNPEYITGNSCSGVAECRSPEARSLRCTGKVDIRLNTVTVT
jgi:hypothetical protein